MYAGRSFAFSFSFLDIVVEQRCSLIHLFAERWNAKLLTEMLLGVCLFPPFLILMAAPCASKVKAAKDRILHIMDRIVLSGEAPLISDRNQNL